jgi:hypothetical protein
MSANFFTSANDSAMPTRYDFELISMASYCEEAVKEKAIKIDEKNLFFPIACQLAVVGWGSKTFGTVKVDGDVVDIKDYFNKVGVLWDLRQDSKIEPDDVTPKRLVRIHRFEINEWMKTYKGESYLVRKYGGRAVRKFKRWIFPGSEHLVVEPEHVEALLLCYKKMDETRGTNFETKVSQVLIARGLM